MDLVQLASLANGSTFRTALTDRAGFVVSSNGRKHDGVRVTWKDRSEDEVLAPNVMVIQTQEEG